MAAIEGGWLMTIIAFGGLCDDWFQWLERGLLTPLRQKYPKVTIARWSWTDSPPNPSDRPLIVVGHSFGGDRAIQYALKCSNVDALVTLDPRGMWTGMGGFTKPSNVALHINIFRNGWMNGWPVAGAADIELKDGTSHVGLPWHPKVHEVVEGFLK